MPSFEKIVSANDGYYLIEGRSDNLRLIKTDNSGTIIWQRQVFGYNLVDLKAKPNGDVIVISSDYECDSHHGVENTKMSIFNSSGNQYFDETLFWTWWGADDYYEPFTKTTCSNVGEEWRLLFNGDSIYKVTDSGEILFRVGKSDWPNLNITYAFLTSGGTILYGSGDIENGDPYYDGMLYFSDTLGDINEGFGIGYHIVDIKEVNATTQIMRGTAGDLHFIINDEYEGPYIEEGIRFIETDNSRIYQLGGYGYFSVYDTDYNEEASVTLSNELVNLTYFSKRNDTIFLAVNKSDNAILFLLDTTLNILDSVSIANVNISDCALGDSLILIAGEEVYHAALNSQNNLVNLPAALLKSVDYQLNTAAPQYDASILSCNINDSYVTWTPANDIVSAILDVKILNAGLTELNNATISLHYETKLYQSECDYAVNNYTFNNLHILPGVDTTLTIGPVSCKAYGNGTTDFTVCVYVYSPNNQMDANHDNNKYCVSDTLSLSIDGVQLSVFKVFPNPATTELTIVGYNPASLKLCNTLGQTVAEAYNTNKLQIAELPKGLYLLQVFDNMGELVKVEKVVKE